MDVQKCPLTNEEKQNMIAEAAYLKSRNRKYPGDPVADWLEAEAELDDALATFCKSADQDPELSAYRRLRTEFRRILGKAGETVNADSIAQALAKATAQLRQVGEFVPESIDRASKAVKQEIADTIDKLGHNWDNFRIRQSELLANWKEIGTHGLNRTTRSFYTWLSRRRSKNDH
jgi:Protein of unknown function (DUF2934)